MIIGCLEPVRTASQLRKFSELGGAGCPDEAERELDWLTPRQLGDLFLVKNGVGAVVSWMRAKIGGGGSVVIEHGAGKGEVGRAIEEFAQKKHDRRRLFAVSWEDETGATRVDTRRVDDRLRSFAGLRRAFVPEGAQRGGGGSKKPFSLT